MKSKKSKCDKLKITVYFSESGWIYTEAFGLLDLLGRTSSDVGVKEKNGRRTLCIPKKIDGYEVNSVDFRGFQKGFDRLVVSEGVSFIGSGAFMGSEELREVRLPKSLLVLGENAFYGTSVPPRRIRTLCTRYEGAFDACFPEMPKTGAVREESPVPFDPDPTEPGSDIPF